MKVNKEQWQEMFSHSDSLEIPYVNHPSHYNHGKYEVIDIIEDWNLGFHCGNAIKYIGRHKYKENGRQDIEKAIWYLERYLEVIDND